MKLNPTNKSLTATCTTAKKISKSLTDYHRTGKTKSERNLKSK